MRKNTSVTFVLAALALTLLSAATFAPSWRAYLPLAMSMDMPAAAVAATVTPTVSVYSGELYPLDWTLPYSAANRAILLHYQYSWWLASGVWHCPPPGSVWDEYFLDKTCSPPPGATPVTPVPWWTPAPWWATVTATPAP